MSLDDQIRQALDRALAGVRGHLETDLRAFAQELARAAADERNRSVSEATEAAVAEVRHKAHTQLSEIRDAAQRHTDELRRSAEAQIKLLERALAEARQQSEAEIEDARRLAQAQVDDVQRMLTERTAELEERLADSDGRLKEATRELDEVRRASTFAEQAQEIGRSADHDQMLRLVSAMEQLDDARSLSEVLDELAQGAYRQVDRVAVLLVRGERLVGWTLMGFGERAPGASTVSLEAADAGVAGAAAQTGAAEWRGAADTTDGVALPPFARDESASARDALALPVVVGGAIVAVLYADVKSDVRADTPRWPSQLGLLARHAGKVLELLTVQQAIGLSLRPRLAEGPHDAVADLSHDGSVQ